MLNVGGENVDEGFLVELIGLILFEEKETNMGGEA